MVRAEATTCGERVASSRSIALTVDSSGPDASINAPAGTSQAGTAHVSWSASDPSGVASYDLEASVDGSAFQPWLTGATATSAGYATAAGHSYAWRVRGRDTFGHVGNWATSAPLTVAAAAPSTPPARPSPLAASNVRITRLTRMRAPVRLALSGTVASSARGGIYVTVRVRRGKTRKTLSMITTPRSGRWKVVLRVPSRHARFTRAEATARYDADFTFAASNARRTLRVREPHRRDSYRPVPSTGLGVRLNALAPSCAQRP